jgi:hypothetical protein
VHSSSPTQNRPEALLRRSKETVIRLAAELVLTDECDSCNALKIL